MPNEIPDAKNNKPAFKNDYCADVSSHAEIEECSKFLDIEQLTKDYNSTCLGKKECTTLKWNSYLDNGADFQKRCNYKQTKMYI